MQIGFYRDNQVQRVIRVGGPYSNMTGVLLKRENLDRETEVYRRKTV